MQTGNSKWLKNMWKFEPLTIFCKSFNIRITDGTLALCQAATENDVRASNNRPSRRREARLTKLEVIKYSRKCIDILLCGWRLAWNWSKWDSKRREWRMSKRRTWFRIRRPAIVEIFHCPEPCSQSNRLVTWVHRPSLVSRHALSLPRLRRRSSMNWWQRFAHERSNLLF